MTHYILPTQTFNISIALGHDMLNFAFSKLIMFNISATLSHDILHLLFPGLVKEVIMMRSLLSKNKTGGQIVCECADNPRGQKEFLGDP